MLPAAYSSGCSHYRSKNCEMRSALVEGRGEINQKSALELKRQVTKEFQVQLALGAPTNHDEDGLRRLQLQLKRKQVVVKLSVKDHCTLSST